MIRLIFISALLIFTTCVVFGQTGSRKSADEIAATDSLYVCPMHPDVKSSKPGKCPKCGMELRPFRPTDETNDAANSTKPIGDEIDSASFSSKIPNVTVINQFGESREFFKDLVDNQVVAVNFIFTTCTTICPPLTATFRKVQVDLQQRGIPVHLISISVDPLTDTPERLLAFSSKFKAAKGWDFLTGDKTQIDSLLRAFGAQVADKNDHTPMIFIGNERTGVWTRTYGLSSPAALEKIIEDVAAMR